MVYIRAKKVKGDQYLYLVKSVWDSKKSTSRQEIVKYLGKATDVTKDDIPSEYREDPKILSFLAAYSPQDIKKKEEATQKSIKLLYKKMTEGELQSSIKIFEDYNKLFEVGDFFDRILKPVMYKIGEDWANNKIDIATEHVASNVAQTLVRIILDRVTIPPTKKKVLICVPLGEEHHLGCDVINSYLSSKGFKVFNMSTSVPTESILKFIVDNDPHVVLVSITLQDNIGAGQRLVKKIKDVHNIPVLVGGWAFSGEGNHKFECQVVKESNLQDLPRLIRSA